MKKSKVIFPLSAICASLALSGCGGMMSATEWFITGNWVPRVTVEEAFGDLKEIPEDENHVFVEEIQPKNKTIACKVLALNQKDAETYWDGSCKNGKAAGLGKITYIQDGNVFERITDNKSKNQDGFSDFYARDYSKKLTIRGQIKKENSYGEEYWVIRETLEENPIKDEAFVFKEFVYHNMDYTIRKIYVPHFDAMFTLVDRKGLRYLRAEMNNPSINAPSMIEGIGKVTDSTLDTTVGMREIPRVSRYTVNGKKNIRSCSQRKQRNHFSRW